MNKKTELIKYFNDKLNANVDLSDILDENGDKFYAENPFIPIIYREVDKGTMKNKIVEEIISELPAEGAVIYVRYEDPELSKEDIQELGADPIESWLGVVGLEFLIPIDDREIYGETYTKIEAFQKSFLRLKVETVNIFGKDRAIDVNSSRIMDMAGSLQVLNSVKFKSVGINVEIQITNKGFVKNIKRFFRVDGETITTIDKQFEFLKQSVDSSTTNNGIVKFIPDSATRKSGFLIPVNFESTLTNKIFDELSSDGTDQKLYQEYVISNVYVLANGTEKLITYTAVLGEVQEITAQKGVVYWTVSFVEV